MANLYFNAAVDTTWDTLLNWWSDAAFTVPSISLPTTGDTVYIGDALTLGPSSPIALNHIYVGDASTGGGSFGIELIGADGNATFNGGCYCAASILTGDITFNDSSSCGGSEIYGTATFNGFSFADNIVEGGSATFNDGSHTDSYYNGSCEFNGNSYNGVGGDIVNYSIFNGFSENRGGLESGGEFHNSSRNIGVIAGGAIVYYDGGDGERPIGGTVDFVTYIGFPPVYGVYYNNTTEDGFWDTIANWWLDAEFTDPSYDLPLENTDVYLAQTMLAGPSTPITLNNIYVADVSTGGGTFGVVFTGASGQATFDDGSNNQGVVDGDALFNAPSTFNNGEVTGTATFYGEDGNSGTCDGNAYFYDTTTNIGTVTGNSTFALTAAVSQIKYYSGGTQGTFTGSVSIAGGAGGGSDQMIARLLNLPWFINL